MNWDEAISVHAGWKSKLANYVKKPDHSLRVAEVAQDNQCALGKWLVAEEAKYASLQEFKTLKAEHTRFHKAAADIVRRADSGQNMAEEVSPTSRSEFRKASVTVVQAIVALRAKA